jgi:hypothetical protein
LTKIESKSAEISAEVKNKTDPELTLDPQLTLKSETSISLKIIFVWDAAGEN